MKHLKYLRYVLWHKWFVMVECFKNGLILRGLLHDLSKFRPSEWFPYANFFYGKPTDTNKTFFDLAWLFHQKRNDHHWQYWILSEDNGGTKILPMSPKARLEMVCDWCGASKAQGHGGWIDVAFWYEKNKDKMQLHPDTRNWIVNFLFNKAAWLKARKG